MSPLHPFYPGCYRRHYSSPESYAPTTPILTHQVTSRSVFASAVFPFHLWLNTCSASWHHPLSSACCCGTIDASSHRTHSVSAAPPSPWASASLSWAPSFPSPKTPPEPSLSWLFQLSQSLSPLHFASSLAGFWSLVASGVLCGSQLWF